MPPYGGIAINVRDRLMRLFIDLIFRVVSMAWGRLGFEITMELGDMFAVTETGGAVFFYFVHFLTPPLLKSTSFKLAYYYFIIFLKKKQYFRETKFVKQKWLGKIKQALIILLENPLAIFRRGVCMRLLSVSPISSGHTLYKHVDSNRRKNNGRKDDNHNRNDFFGLAVFRYRDVRLRLRPLR